MEIDIPDLDDVRFQCRCVACGGTKKIYTSRELPRERDARGRLKQTKYDLYITDCTACNGTGLGDLSPVGERLVDVLKYLGVEMKR